MSFLDLHNEVKSVISKHLSNDMKISKVFMSKHDDFQKLFFGEMVFDDEYDQIRQAPGRISDDDVFKNEFFSEITRAIKSTLGPSGMEKFLLKRTGENIITNDGATILDNLNFLNPISTLIAEVAKSLKTGQEFTVTEFETGDTVDVIGMSKGKGFAGTIKRHHFAMGPVTHGSHNVRQPGSIGSAYPQRVFKGTKMSGHLGHDRVTVKNLKIVEIHPKEGLLVVAGAVPGARGTILTVKGA
jgi:hypothetical protein